MPSETVGFARTTSVMTLFITVFLWVGMAAACALFSGDLGRGALIAIIAACSRSLLPPPNLRRFVSYDPFVALYPTWAVIVTVAREDHTHATILLVRGVAALAMLAVAGWCLYRDWHRFGASAEARTG